jgi:predicted AlkP superfamily phosphohydrolase/phosphomutase
VADDAGGLTGRPGVSEHEKVADHGGYDYSTTAGVLIANRRLTTSTPTIMDLAPTVLKYFGVPVPAEIDGKAVF